MLTDEEKEALAKASKPKPEQKYMIMVKKSGALTCSKVLTAPCLSELKKQG